MLCISACYNTMGPILKVTGTHITLSWVLTQFVLPLINHNMQEDFKILKLINIFK